MVFGLYFCLILLYMYLNYAFSTYMYTRIPVHTYMKSHVCYDVCMYYVTMYVCYEGTL